MTLEALIFDVDGTLADTERGHLVAFNLAFKEAGLDWDWSSELYETLLSVTGGKERIRYYLDEFNLDFKKPDNFSDFVASLHAAKTQHYTELLAEGAIPLRPGVARLINEARGAGVRLAIATTTSHANIEALLIHTLGAESLDWFEVIAAGDIVAAKKPAADIYRYTLEELQLPAEKCLALEDSYNGVVSARGANITTVITINDYTKKHDFTGAAVVLDQYGEPDSPARVLQGNRNAVNQLAYVDLESLRKLHQHA